jgi:hypothetical protein
VGPKSYKFEKCELSDRNEASPEKAGGGGSIPSLPPFIINNLQIVHPKPPLCGGFSYFLMIHLFSVVYKIGQMMAAKRLASLISKCKLLVPDG